MGKRRTAIAFIVALSLSGGIRAQDAATSCRKMPGTVELAAELVTRAETDQEVRQALFSNLRDQGLTFEQANQLENRSLLAPLERVDQGNLAWLKTVVDARGWPGRSLVGQEGAHAAWLLVQHASDDLSFQKHCLELMQSLPEGEVAPEDIAYLTDRVRIAERQKQVFGTQLVFKDGELVLAEVEDPAGLDERRKSVGLAPVEQYLEMSRAVYAKPSESKPESSD